MGATKTGIVLQTYDIRDSSRMVDLFTLEEGRISMVARGARRDKSRFLNLTAPYVEGSFDVISGKNQLYLKDGTIANAHLGLRKSFAHLTSARFATEALLGILVGEGEEPDLFHLYQVLLPVLEGAEASQLSYVIGAFLVKLVSFAGFRPTLGHCIECERAITSQEVGLDFEGGGVYCAEHGRKPHSVLLSRSEYVALVDAIRQPLRAIISLYALNGVDGLRFAKLCFRYYGTHTGRDRLRTLPMMQRLHLL